MPRQDINEILDQLLSLPGETEWVEFKTARDDFSFEKLGKYFSALSNEANLYGKQCGWLMFGIDRDRNICGTNYRSGRPHLDSLKHAVAQHTTEKLTFVEIHVLFPSEKRVILFEIPPALPGIPTKW
ncbi:MAG: ATP-binding protein, partial [candidate division Zixibacteria bacterium]|nr:ATP-binding protein [candidate division Zixibacteria bacterium]